MRRTFTSGLVVALLGAGAVLAAWQGAAAQPPTTDRTLDPTLVAVGGRHVCHDEASGAICTAVAATNRFGRIVQSSKPLAGAFTPQMLQQAYGVTGLTSGGRTVAIIDYGGYPTLESDLATFRSQYGLGACTTANGCLTIEGQDGGAPPADGDQGWMLERALDVDAVSAMCPDCKILMVQASSDFDQAVNTAAATAGVVAVSNSYVYGNTGNDPAYEHKNVAMVAATGDWGYGGGEYPASDTYVTAVGGTSLYADGSTRGFSESTWSGTGSGCGINPVARWQRPIHTTCDTKADSDVSAASDPSNGGLNVYDTQGYGGWVQVGGTSEATPIVAAIYALSGHTKGWPARIPYRAESKKHLYDITSGSNGSCGIPLCVARKGWDGPTGLGSPHGVGAF